MNAKAEKKTYEIVSLEVENFKRISAVSIHPDGSLIELTGRNAQGKSSVLDAIWAALAGKAAAPAVPVRRGAEKATIRLDLGELKVTRTFKAQDDGGYTTSIIVENAEGARFTSPQSMLEGLIGELTFDPLEFERAKPAEQFETLKSFVPDFDFDADERGRKADYDARTAVNRRVDELKAVANGIDVPADAPASEVDDSALADELAAAAGKNTRIAEAEAARAAQAREIERDREAAAAKRDQAAELERKAKALQAEAEADAARAAAAAKAHAALPALPAPIDVDGLRKQMDDAKRANAAFAAAQRKAEVLARVEHAEKASADLTAKLRERAAARQAAIAAAKMPVSSLSFGDGVVLLDGVPFAQASDAERLRASIAIAMSMNTKLRVVRIRDGSRLDSESVQVVAAMAKERGYQVWMETVQSGRPSALVIEDGAVKALAEAAE